jgi:hypothetical protein
MVGTAGSQSSLENALSQIKEYGLKMPRALQLMQQGVPRHSFGVHRAGLPKRCSSSSVG